MYFNILGYNIKRGLDFLINDLEERIMLSEAHDKNDLFNNMKRKYGSFISYSYQFDGYLDSRFGQVEDAEKEIESLRTTRMFVLDGTFYQIHYTQLSKLGLNRIKGVLE